MIDNMSLQAVAHYQVRIWVWRAILFAGMTVASLFDLSWLVQVGLGLVTAQAIVMARKAMLIRERYEVAESRSLARHIRRRTHDPLNFH